MNRVWIGPIRQVLIVSHQGQLPSPFNNSNQYELIDANESDKKHFDKYVSRRIPDI